MSLHSRLKRLEVNEEREHVPLTIVLLAAKAGQQPGRSERRTDVGRVLTIVTDGPVSLAESVDDSGTIELPDDGYKLVAGCDPCELV